MGCIRTGQPKQSLEKETGRFKLLTQKAKGLLLCLFYMQEQGEMLLCHYGSGSVWEARLQQVQVRLFVTNSAGFLSEKNSAHAKQIQ